MPRPHGGAAMRPRPRANRCATLCWLLLATAFGALLSNSWATFRELTTHEPWARPAPAPTPRPSNPMTPQPTSRRTPQPTPGTQAAALREKLDRVASANTAAVRSRDAEIASLREKVRAATLAKAQPRAPSEREREEKRKQRARQVAAVKAATSATAASGLDRCQAHWDDLEGVTGLELRDHGAGDFLVQPGRVIHLRHLSSGAFCSVHTNLFHFARPSVSTNDT